MLARPLGDRSPTSDGLVLFGALGDLALKMLFPALAWLEADGLLPPQLPIVAVSRADLDGEAARGLIRKRLARHAPETLAAGAADRLLARTQYICGDLTEPDTAGELLRAMARLKIEAPLFYFSVSPSLYGIICEHMLAAGPCGEAARAVMEKPIGKSLATARLINDRAQAAFSEGRIFRIDHYLGKETVQNLLAVRFANSLFEPLWNHQAIDHVQISVSETDGVGSRWPYYDEFGATGDMVQNHILQLLCLLCMEAPADLSPDSVRNEKVKVLRALRPIGSDEVASNVVRGQYFRGAIAGCPVPGYAEEKGSASDTETFVAIQAHIDNWRWAGVPFYLRTGKRMPRRETEILVQFKSLPHSIFGRASEAILANNLLIRLQPEEDIVLNLMNRVPGSTTTGADLRSLPLSLSLRQPGERRRIAYESLILDALRGDPTLFVRRDEVEVAWQWIDGIARAVQVQATTPIPYPAGTWGPAQADELLIRNGRAWRRSRP